MLYVVLSDLYMYHANIDFICFDSASNLSTDTNSDVNINGSQDAELPAYNDPAVISKIAEFHAELASLDPVGCSTLPCSLEYTLIISYLLLLCMLPLNMFRLAPRCCLHLSSIFERGIERDTGAHNALQ